MATLVVEDGTGLPTANGYVSRANADDILSVNIHSTWSSLADVTKDNLIIYATRLLNQYARWKGTRVYDTSGTPWPRSGIYDQDSREYANDEIPEPLEIATSTLADWIATTNPFAVSSAENGLEKIKVDVIELNYNMDAAMSPTRWPPDLAAILRDLCYLRIGRGNGVPIVKH